jgi:hypothetical protein
MAKIDMFDEIKGEGYYDLRSLVNQLVLSAQVSQDILMQVERDQIDHDRWIEEQDAGNA